MRFLIVGARELLSPVLHLPLEVSGHTHAVVTHICEVLLQQLEGLQRTVKVQLTPLRIANAEVRLSELNRLENPVTLLTLIGAGIVPQGTIKAKVILSGALKQPVALQGIAVTAGARAAIEAAGGTIQE